MATLALTGGSFKLRKIKELPAAGCHVVTQVCYGSAMMRRGGCGGEGFVSPPQGSGSRAPVLQPDIVSAFP